MHSTLPPVTQQLVSRWERQHTPSTASVELHSGQQHKPAVAWGSSQLWMCATAFSMVLLKKRNCAKTNQYYAGGDAQEKVVDFPTTARLSIIPIPWQWREASWLETSTINKHNIVWLEQTTCSFPRASLSSLAMMNILSPAYSHIFLLAVAGFLAAGPDIDKAGTGFSALYNVAIAQ